jgi:hypothetical protein
VGRAREARGSMALVSEKCATTDERWGDGAVWRGVFPTAGVTPPNCAKAFAAPILTNGFRSLVHSGLKSDVAPCRLCADFVAEIGMRTARDGWCHF